MKIYQYLCLRMKMICWRFIIKTPFSFWDICDWDVWKVCFDMNTNMYENFKICISVPSAYLTKLRKLIENMDKNVTQVRNYTMDWNISVKITSRCWDKCHIVHLPPPFCWGSWVEPPFRFSKTWGVGGGVLEKGKSPRKRKLGRFADLRGELDTNAH